MKLFPSFRISSLLIFCLCFGSTGNLETVAQPLVSKSNPHHFLAQNSSNRMLSRWELAFGDYKSGDGTYAYKIPGSCPIERPGARCGYPRPEVTLERASDVTATSIFGGNYEIAFNINVFEFHQLKITPAAQEAMLIAQINRARQKHEGQEGGTLVAANEFKVNGHRAVELRWKGGRYSRESSTTIIRMIAAGNRTYVLTVGTSDSLAPALQGDITTFLNGFSVLKPT